jgi:hypothetical protein
MMVDLTQRSSLREGLRALPSLAIATTGTPPSLEEMFFPDGHAEVLDPDVSLVIGNRGMGKTFWALALADSVLRPEIARRYFGSRSWNLDALDVVLGFSDAEGASGVVSRAQLDSVPKSMSTEIIWRSVVLKCLYSETQLPGDGVFRDLVKWVRDHPEEQQRLFRQGDLKFAKAGQRLMIVFDQLDQLGQTWDRIQKLTQGLLKVALSMKSYKSIKIKIFMRPDQAEDKQLFRFPDASKILGGGRNLTWKPTELYGLLFFHLRREVNTDFDRLCEVAGVAPDLHVKLGIPNSLVGNQEHQASVFDALAGEMMGKGSKRGRPYTWISTHLADARGEISPRTFLKVMKTAAEWDDPPPQDTPIDYHGIQEGVRSASSVRLSELEEDYPWVSMALEPLRGLLVPCSPSEIVDRWMEGNTAARITTTYQDSSAPLDVVFANMLETPREESLALLKVLTEIGILEERSNGKINVPDIFRVNAGILRKGGVTPTQRRRFG